jgi:hypothetical protein
MINSVRRNGWSRAECRRRRSKLHSTWSRCRMVWMRCSISFAAVFADIGDELVARHVDDKQKADDAANASTVKKQRLRDDLARCLERRRRLPESLISMATPWPASVSLLRRRRTTATRPPHPQTAMVVNAISNNGGSKTFHCHTKDMTAVLVFF